MLKYFPYFTTFFPNFFNISHTFSRVDYSLEYENLEKLYLESVLISKKKHGNIEKKQR